MAWKRLRVQIPTSPFVKPLKYVREDGFELAVYMNSATYADRNGEIRIEYSQDGSGTFDGEHTSFERLYDILKNRRDLRIVMNGAIRMDTGQSDSTFLEDAPEIIGKIAQISDWLGITTPYLG